MSRKALKVIGLMSGTSLDGVDAAIVDTDGEKILGLGARYFRPYGENERRILEEATQAALKWNFKGPPPNIFVQAEELVDQAHVEAVEGLIAQSELVPRDIDYIGYHGQTILHRPPETGRIGMTLQLGRGQTLVEKLAVSTVFDFRTNDVEQGGQGAPLAPVYHRALLEYSGILAPACVLNIGGVSNYTLLSPDGDLLATDCGAGNGPLDSWVQKCGQGDFDENGHLALAGTPDFDRIERWLNREFFQKKPPKSADRWDFDVLGGMDGLSVEDGAATLVGFLAMAVKTTLNQSGQNPEKIIVCGGGRHNPAIMAALREQKIGEIVSAEQIGWSGDDIEAQAFAFLAVRSVLGLPLSYPGTTGVRAPVSGGKLIEKSKGQSA